MQHLSISRRALLAGLAATPMVGLLSRPARAASGTIRIVMKDLLTTNPEDVAHIGRIEEALAARGHDISIEIVDLPSEGYAEKLNLMLLSGDIPDVIYFQGGDEQIAQQGVLQDLGSLIEGTEHLAPALWPHNTARMANYPYLLYVFPARTKAPVIRRDLLEATGLSAPASLEEWDALLRAIPGIELDGTTVSHGIIAPNNTDEMDAVFDPAFGIDRTWMQDEAGEWIHSRISAGEREKLAWYASLYADGVLDPEFVTSNWEVKEDKFYTGQVGVVMGTAGPVIGIYEAKMAQVNPGAELVLLTPPAGIQAIDVSKESRGFAIPVTTEQTEAVIAFLDFMASPEGQMMDRLGFEGEHYTRDGDTLTPTDKLGAWYPRFVYDNPNHYQPPISPLSDLAQASLQQGVDNFRADNSFVWPADLAAAVDGAETYYRTNVFRFVSGELSTERDWDAYVQGWLDAGGQAMIDHAKAVL
ncbi:extracellular solute-binding protein [Limimaricola pyoseonensis]|uniref:Putative aldouronate transport system substrate-binding protein n=1 Tax=Limimaricola pyoseonensis TaxID=521013 RepID=A0A1G7IJJ3_9RHOB|nr:extracellular solute-binding protein [Limimaricola pyoseonensis]SDF12748.1 putative aldouronate transport system substrate-binding protein [Limimaricola pyoseonensis]